METTYLTKEHKEEKACPACGEMPVDDFCDTCNKYISSESAHKKLSEKYPYVRCKCKSNKIAFCTEKSKTPAPKNFLDKAALGLIEKYNRKYPQDIPPYREVARCRECGYKWCVDGYRDDDKTMVFVRNAFIAFLVIICFVLIVATGCVFEGLRQNSEDDNAETTSQVGENNLAEQAEDPTEIAPSTSLKTQAYGKIGSDTEIVLKENHPEFLDDVNMARYIWKAEISEGKVIILGSDDSTYSREHIIEIGTKEEGQGKNTVEYISSVNIYFDRFDEVVPFDDALDVIAEYLPEEKIKQCYTEEMSFSELTDFENHIRYSKAYKLKVDSDSSIVEPAFSFAVMIWVDKNGNATEAAIDTVVFPPFDDETMDEWSYDYFLLLNEDAVSTTEAVTTTNASKRVVYITPYGEKYHYSARCAGRNAIERDHADVEGAYGPCKKCAH